MLQQACDTVSSLVRLEIRSNYSPHAGQTKNLSQHFNNKQGMIALVITGQILLYWEKYQYRSPSMDTGCNLP